MIGTKWVDKYYLRDGKFKGIIILSDTRCQWWGDALLGTSSYSPDTVRNNFIQVPNDIPDEAIKLYLALCFIEKSILVDSLKRRAPEGIDTCETQVML